MLMHSKMRFAVNNDEVALGTELSYSRKPRRLCINKYNAMPRCEEPFYRICPDTLSLPAIDSRNSVYLSSGLTHYFAVNRWSAGSYFKACVIMGFLEVIAIIVNNPCF